MQEVAYSLPHPEDNFRSRTELRNVVAFSTNLPGGRGPSRRGFCCKSGKIETTGGSGNKAERAARDLQEGLAHVVATGPPDPVQGERGPSGTPRVEAHASSPQAPVVRAASAGSLKAGGGAFWKDNDNLGVAGQPRGVAPSTVQAPPPPWTALDRWLWPGPNGTSIYWHWNFNFI